MKKLFFCLFTFLPTVWTLSAADVDDRLARCATVMDEILNVPDSIPRELLDKAECAIVVPGVKKVAFGFGGSYGRGAMVCRGGGGFTGPWGAPTMIRLEGGSFGLQLGGSETDFVLLVMNKGGAEGIFTSKIKLGADATAAAGPKGRSAEASTDATLKAEILSYSRSRGLIAGVSLQGSSLRQDSGPNQRLYGRTYTPREIALEGKVAVPKSAERLVKLLQKASPKNKSD